MSTIILVIHLLIAVAMIILILLQRSEGGALGIGGGNMMSGRTLGNALTRATTIMAVIFFITSIALTVFGTMENKKSILDGVIEETDRDGVLAPAPVLPEPDLPVPSN